MNPLRCAACALYVALPAAAAQGLDAQTVRVTPAIGIHAAAGSFGGLVDAADEAENRREATLALGIDIGFGPIQGVLRYAGGATLSDTGIRDGERLREGKVLAAAAALALRPIPRIVATQPFLLLGGGLKHEDPDLDRLDFDLDDERTSAAAFLGAGIDIELGATAIVAQVGDFVSRTGDGDWTRHDGFASLGLSIRVF